MVAPRPFAAWLIVGAFCLAASPAAQGDEVIARVTAGQTSWVAQQYDLEVTATLSGHDASELVVLSDEHLSAEQILDLLQGDDDVFSAEAAASLALLGDAEAVDDGTALDLLRQGTVSSRCYEAGFAGEIWNGFGDQQAAALVELADAHAATQSCGDAIVALLDTGVDPEHPLLAGALVDGYDFIAGEAGIASDWANLRQSVSAILEQSVSAILEQSVSAILEGDGELLILNASMAPITGSDATVTLDGLDVPPYFGHGTMAAGLVRLSAPGARIMPLRVFDGSGQAQLFDIIRAIYWATDQGADVINMSFSTEVRSPELHRAIRYAHDRGVLLVAAAGNRGQREASYPAAYSEVVGVASSNFSDQLSPFSNYGTNVADLAAPGSAVVSTYPGGLFAAGWGTSFAAPLVSGTLALMVDGRDLLDKKDAKQTLKQLRKGAASVNALKSYIASGRRLDSSRAVNSK